MTNSKAEVKRSITKEAYHSLREHLRIPLFANAYALIANQVMTAGLGFIYWIAAARLYPVEVVGKNSAILSTVLFIAMLAELTFKAGAIRFIPRAGKNIRKLLLAAMGINLTIALLIGIFIVTVGKHFSLTEELMESVDFWPGWLVMAGMIWCLFYVQDGILTGFRQAKWVAVKNALHSIFKLILLFALYRVVSDYGILISWFAPVIVFILLIYVLIFWRLIPHTSFGDGVETKPITMREAARSISGDYIGSMLLETCIRMLPLIVLQQLGDRATAFYYQAWIVANPIYMVASGMTQSFAVEASANMRELPYISRRILRQMLLLIMPVTLVVFLGAHLIMSVFGPSYATESTGLLRWLMLATVPLIINYWFLNYSRVTGSGKSIILVQGITSVVALTASTLWIPKGGITSIGIAWFLAQSVIAIPVLIKSAPILFKREKQDTFGEHAKQNLTLRRVDWRFLLSLKRWEKAVCFSTDENLREALSSIFASVDEKTLPDIIPDHDLAVAVNPTKNILHAAANALRSGGQVYTEWSAWRMGGKNGILRRMHKAGFSTVKMYIPFPSQAYPRVWIPLDASEAPRSYIARWLFPNDGLVHRMGRWAVKVLLRFVLQKGLSPSISAVGTKGTLSSQDTFSRIQFEWSSRHPETPPCRLSFLVQTPGASSVNKIVFLVFVETEPEPMWAVKIPRLPDGVQSLQDECDLLNELYRTAKAQASPIVLPEPVFQFDLDQVKAFGQTAMKGIPLQQILQSGNLREISLQLTRWQIALAQLSRDWHHEISSEQFVEKLFASIKAQLGTHTEIADTIVQTGRILSSLNGIPLTCVHNDFTIWNVKQKDEGLAVFDWTDAFRSGPPMLDLVYGLASTVLLLEKAWDVPDRARHIYLNLLVPSTPTGAIFNECIKLYADRFQLKTEHIAPLRLLTWVLNVSFDLQLRRFERENIPRPYDSMYFSLWKAELEAQQQARNITSSDVG